MRLPKDFIDSLEAPPPHELFEMVASQRWPRGGCRFEFVNDIKPSDLFCYLGGRFGPPNGMQSFLRKDDSDNLIHWEWTLRYPQGLISFSGMNFRTEIHVHGETDWDDGDKEEIIKQVKADFGRRASEMAKVRRLLENWVEFVNPYQRIKRATDSLLDELGALNLQPDRDRMDDVWSINTRDQLKLQWDAVASRYARGFGLCFGIRSMLPVLAESYINLVLFILMRPELKGDQRLRDAAVRQPIDVRIRGLSLNCVGFERQPDYSSEPCKRYHTLVNERNDLLHGNVVIDKLKFNEVYFLGKVPVFKEYRSMWRRSLDVEMDAVGLRAVHNEVEVVQNLIGYIGSCMENDVRAQVDQLVNSYELGLNKATQRLGILFPPWLVDMRMDVQNATGGAGTQDQSK